MGMVVNKANTKHASISAVVHRADGRVENLGVISYYHRNPVIHHTVNAWIKLKEKLRWSRASRTAG